jgi:hypothetical protein
VRVRGGVEDAPAVGHRQVAAALERLGRRQRLGVDDRLDAGGRRRFARHLAAGRLRQLGADQLVDAAAVVAPIGGLRGGLRRHRLQRRIGQLLLQHRFEPGARRRIAQRLFEARRVAAGRAVEPVGHRAVAAELRPAQFAGGDAGGRARRRRRGGGRRRRRQQQTGNDDASPQHGFCTLLLRNGAAGQLT